MNHPITRPTYEEHIKEMFTQGDINCMINRGVNLSNYDSVRAEASRILEWVGSGKMPPPGTGRTWSDEKLQTFRNWTEKSGFAEHKMVRLKKSDTVRVRKNILEMEVGGDELELLKKAFIGIRALDTDTNAKNSFFNMAGIHWLPGPWTQCRHHDNAYNPWHRAYLHAFEDALRSIDGCENVTLPYWDILGKELPDWIYEPPFSDYKLPYDLRTLDNQRVYRSKGTATVRDSASKIFTNVKGNDNTIGKAIRDALSADTWEKFNGWSGGTPVHDGIIKAHDAGHGACGHGSTVSDQNIAAFDPLFWFFHCNWDRLWWKWQTDINVVELADFEKTVQYDRDWLADIPGNILAPFSVVSSEMINLNKWNVTYQHPPEENIPEPDILLMASGNANAEKAFRIPSTDRYSVRVKGINRLNISGSFYVMLYSGEEILRQTYVFQPSEPNECDNCRKHGVFSTDFIVNKSELNTDNEIRIGIDLINDSGDRQEIPISVTGEPTVNVRLLLE